MRPAREFVVFADLQEVMVLPSTIPPPSLPGTARCRKPSLAGRALLLALWFSLPALAQVPSQPQGVVAENAPGYRGRILTWISELDTASFEIEQRTPSVMPTPWTFGASFGPMAQCWTRDRYDRASQITTQFYGCSWTVPDATLWYRLRGCDSTGCSAWVYEPEICCGGIGSGCPDQVLGNCP